MHEKFDYVKTEDGDTIWIKTDGIEKKIRLVGLDAFENELNNRVYNQAKKHCIAVDEVLERGREAKNLLEKILQNHTQLIIDLVLTREYKKHYDNYGRLLGTVYLADGSNLNEGLKTHPLFNA